MQGLYETLMTHSLITKHKRKRQKLAEKVKAAVVATEKVERDRDAEVGKIWATLDKRISKVESLRIQLYMVKDQVIIVEELVHTVEEKHVTIKKATTSIEEA